MCFIGRELCSYPGKSFLEKVYTFILGAPANGLRIRARRVLPFVTGHYEKILDSGCGKGVFTYWLAKKFPSAKVVGIDIEKELVTKNNTVCKRLNLENCLFENFDLLKLPYKNEFDLILSIDNLEHIEDDASACKKLYDVLKDNGKLILHVPGKYRRWFFWKWRENFHVPGHFRPGYTKEEIVNRLEAAGFEVTLNRYTFSMLETWTNNISYSISKAEEKNKIIYALVFPFLLLISWFGQFSWPQKGAGVVVIANKRGNNL